MLTLNLSFRRLILKYVPQLKSKDLDKFENLTALRNQIYEDIKGYGWSNSREKYIKSATHNLNSHIIKTKASNIINFERVQKFYIAARQFALQQKKIQQIPTSIDALWKLMKSVYYYRKVQIQTLPFLWLNQFFYYKTKFIAALSVLIVIFFTQFINYPPEIKTTQLDSAFVNINYNYPIFALDPNLNDTLQYSLLSNAGFLSIGASTGLLHGTPDTVHVGSDTFRVKVIDSDSLIDTRLYTVNVSL